MKSKREENLSTFMKHNVLCMLILVIYIQSPHYSCCKKRIEQKRFLKKVKILLNINIKV